MGRDNEFCHSLYFEVSIHSLVNSHNTWKLGTKVPTTEIWVMVKYDSNKLENKTAKYLGSSKFKSVYLHTLLIKYSLLMFSPKGTFLQKCYSCMDKMIINQSFLKETSKCIWQSQAQVLQATSYFYC